MAVVSITDSNLRRQDMEGAVSGTSNIGAGAGPSTFVEAAYQGAQSWGRKAGAANALRGFHVTITSIDMTAAGDEVLLWKAFLVNSSDIDVLGLRAHIGSATSADHVYILADDGTQGDAGEFAYPIKSGWLVIPIDPNVTAWRDVTNGSPTLTAITEVGISGAVNNTTLNENIILDAIDFGPGLFLVGGDSTDPDGTWADFVTDDEGTATAGRFGHVATQEGILFIFGTMVIGRTGGATVTATVFNDADQTLVFPGGLVGTGWNSVELDLGNASTDITLLRHTMIGRGRDNLHYFFDSSARQVDGTNEEIDITAHGFATGDAVLYDQNSGGTIGLTDGTEYFVRRVTADSFALHATRQDAFTNTSAIDLTPQAISESNEIFRRQPDTRPDLIMTGTSGSATLNACSIQRFRVITLTSAGTLLDCVILAATTINVGQGTITGCVISEQVTAIGEALVVTSDLVDIDTSAFTAGSGGHAIEIDTAGTYTFSGNTFSGYGPAAQLFNALDDVDAGADTITITGHPYTTGDPVYYSDEGGSVVGGLTDQNLYYVESEDANTISMHRTRAAAVATATPIGLTANGDELHALYSANAAIFNSSGGLVTINVSDGDTPTIRNNAGSSIAINNNVAVTLTGMKDNTEIRVYATGTTTELAGIENATVGTVDNRSFTFSLGAAVDVDIRIHSISYEPIALLVFTIPALASAIPIQQQFDRNYENP